MRHVIAALKSGSDPVAPLPAAAFHRTLEDPIYCPKCEATYFLVADFDWVVSRHFEEESRRHIALLKKTITHGHSHGHRVTHFETNGVVVQRHEKPEPEPAPDVRKMKPATRHIN